MRPIGEASAAVELALADGPGTTRQIAQRTGWSIGVTRYTLNNLRGRDRVIVARRVREVGVKRPVPVYALAGVGEGTRRRGVVGGSSAVAELMAMWGQQHGAR